MTTLTRQARTFVFGLGVILAEAWDVLRHNLRLALVALFVSSVLWVVVTYDQNPPRVDLFPNTLPVEVVNSPANVEVTRGLDPVNVRLAAPAESWGRLRSTSFRLTIDLTNAQAGVHEYPIIAQAADPSVRVIEVIPDRASLLLEPVITRTVPVRVNVVDQVPFGFTSGIPRAAPDSVVVSGAESRVQQVEAAVASIRMDGQRVAVNQTVRLQPSTANGEAVANVRVEPVQAQVEIPVDQQLVYRVVPVTPNVVGQPAVGYWVQSAVADPSTVTIVGDKAAVENIPFVSTATIDINGITGQETRTATLALPPGVSVASGGTVRVAIVVAVQTGSRPFDVSPVAANLAPGRTAIVSPTEFVVTGPVPGLRSDSFAYEISVDVANLGPGEHTLTPTVTVPPGYVISQPPRPVTVTIR